MISQANAIFWALYHALPEPVRVQARQAFRLFRENPDHPGLRFKKLNGTYALWSVRFGDGYRAVGQRQGDTIIWLRGGTHQAFNKSFWKRLSPPGIGVKMGGLYETELPLQSFSPSFVHRVHDLHLLCPRASEG